MIGYGLAFVIGYLATNAWWAVWGNLNASRLLEVGSCFVGGSVFVLLNWVAGKW